MSPTSRTNNKRHDASFRDPSGYMTAENGTLKRIINPIYFPQYEALKKAGVFDTLISKGLLIPHSETDVQNDRIELTPERIPFITNPYEWSFAQFKHAALLTLKLQKFALSRGFILKDATAYNVTFHQGKPMFIDTLSFDFYEEGQPWRAYKQFIMHFLGPLVLARYHGTEIFKMLQAHIDGLPVSLISSLLPWKTRFNPTIYTNIHLLAKLEAKHEDDYKSETRVKKISKKAQLNIVESLFDFVKKLELKERTEWGDYYDKTNYDNEAFKAKKELIREWIKPLNAKRLIDVGGNDGTFARAVADLANDILVSDIDPAAVEQNYLQVRQNSEAHILPFVGDVLQPAPGIGLNNQERSSLIDRLTDYAPDVSMALALIHHLTLSGNVPFDRSARFFAKFSRYLVIEFPRREDSWVQSLLTRKREFINHFDFYNQQHFEEGYGHYFDIEKRQQIPGSERVLYLLKNKENGR